jgi:hypothetical protein
MLLRIVDVLGSRSSENFLFEIEREVGIMILDFKLQRSFNAVWCEYEAA